MSFKLHIRVKAMAACHINTFFFACFLFPFIEFCLEHAFNTLNLRLFLNQDLFYDISCQFSTVRNKNCDHVATVLMFLNRKSRRIDCLQSYAWDSTTWFEVLYSKFFCFFFFVLFHPLSSLLFFYYLFMKFHQIKIIKHSN
jgi:hypothetical protein